MNASLDVDRLGWGKVTVVNVRENMIVRQYAHAILEICSYMQVWIDRSEDFWRMPDANHNLLIICEDKIMLYAKSVKEFSQNHVEGNITAGIAGYLCKRSPQVAALRTRCRGCRTHRRIPAAWTEAPGVCDRIRPRQIASSSELP